MLVRQVFDTKLAQYAYLVGCPRTGEAIVIDPQRDVDRYFELAARSRLRLVAAADTHIHADYLSGLRELAERGLRVYASREGGPDWQYEWLRGSSYDHRLLGEGERFTVGRIELLARHTPGHTPEHLMYLVRDGGSGAGDFMAVASGDFVFVGDVGRPDLLETAAGVTGSMEPGARALFRSIRDGFRALPEFLQVWPGHGAGSACGKALGDVPMSTVGYELRHNPSIQAASDEAGFVRFILSGQPEPPPYFARMKRENKEGPRVLGALPDPQPLHADDLPALCGRGHVVLDTRSRAAFLAGHPEGAIHTELDYQFCAMVGSFVDHEAALSLVVSEARVEEAVRALVRIGYDRVSGYVTPAVLAEYASAGGALVATETIDMRELERRRRDGGVQVLDVRGRAEFARGHVPGATNIPHTGLLARLGELVNDVPVLVHCNAGGRAAAVVGVLERHGYRVADVDDHFANYPEPRP